MPVVTDNPEGIPAQYRSSAGVIGDDGQPDRQDKSRSGTQGFFGRLLTAVGGMFGGKTSDSGMSADQSNILTYAGLLAGLCLVGMNLSRSQAFRFLSLWCLIMIGIATPVLLYISDDGAGDIMKRKAAQVERQHRERLTTIP
ncbi:hypothetical protein W02_04520 [Nitrospira sp. KM1]|uniref:hypothetical protein n=1 Tax=Nitrospira sp. KM1 TaxID=1936990 RepID=UPI0013A73893|nr:hypothetical protein [Nitrospira sp. KM1]BCA53312.1 hypothetical protein W02_04520 [Nitrospira sp. KM1]